MTREEFLALPAEQQEAAVIATHAQMILDLMRAARIPATLRTIAAMQVAMETIAEEIEANPTPEDKALIDQKLGHAKEIYLASNMHDARKGGTHKVIITGE
jgi:hypothetical protein